MVTPKIIIVCKEGSSKDRLGNTLLLQFGRAHQLIKTGDWELASNQSKETMVLWNKQYGDLNSSYNSGREYSKRTGKFDRTFR